MGLSICIDTVQSNQVWHFFSRNDEHLIRQVVWLCFDLFFEFGFREATICDATVHISQEQKWKSNENQETASKYCTRTSLKTKLTLIKFVITWWCKINRLINDINSWSKSLWTHDVSQYSPKLISDPIPIDYQADLVPCLATLISFMNHCKLRFYLMTALCQEWCLTVNLQLFARSELYSKLLARFWPYRPFCKSPFFILNYLKIWLSIHS